MDQRRYRRRLLISGALYLAPLLIFLLSFLLIAATCRDNGCAVYAFMLIPVLIIGKIIAILFLSWSVIQRVLTLGISLA